MSKARGESPVHLVHPSTGVLFETCPNCDGVEKELRAWRTRYANLKKEVEAGWQDKELFPEAKRLFDFWRDRCKHPYHPRSQGPCGLCGVIQFTIDRFDVCMPHLRDLGINLCKRAIEGAAYDPFTQIRRNGTLERYNSWELIFRNRDKVEYFANRAPYHLPDPKKIKVLADALMFLGWVRPDQAVAEATKRLSRSNDAQRSLL